MAAFEVTTEAIDSSAEWTTMSRGRISYQSHAVFRADVPMCPLAATIGNLQMVSTKVLARAVEGPSGIAAAH